MDKKNLQFFFFKRMDCNVYECLKHYCTTLFFHVANVSLQPYSYRDVESGSPERFT